MDSANIAPESFNRDSCHDSSSDDNIAEVKQQTKNSFKDPLGACCYSDMCCCKFSLKPKHKMVKSIGKPNAGFTSNEACEKSQKSIKSQKPVKAQKIERVEAEPTQRVIRPTSSKFLSFDEYFQEIKSLNVECSNMTCPFYKF